MNHLFLITWIRVRRQFLSEQQQLHRLSAEGEALPLPLPLPLRSETVCSHVAL